jgi:hypothetical protein
MKRLFSLLTVLAALALGMNAVASPFGSGNIIIYRMGDGTQPVTNIGQSVFLDEYTQGAILSNAGSFTSPTPVQTIAMPTNWVGNQAPLIASGPGSDEGQMSLSKDGRYLVLTGFGATIGQLTNLTTYAFPTISSNADVSGSYATNAVTEADVPRVIGLVDGLGHIYTSTTITNSDEEGDEIRSSASLDGTNIWYGGGDGKVVKYTVRGSSVATQVCANTGFEPMRSVGIFNNTVYVDKSTAFGGATATNVLTNPYAGGPNLPALLPVSSIPTNFVPINSIGSNSAQGFIMFNLANGNIQNGMTNPDTLYLADSSVNFPGESHNYGGALLKYIYTNSAWIFEGEIGGEDAYGVTGVEASPTNITLYFTEGTNAVLYSYNDTTGYGGNPPYIGEAGAEILWHTQLINVRGIAVAPQGGDSGTLTGGPGITIGPPYGPYFRGPQGGPFTPSNGVAFSVANLSANAGSFSINFSGTSFLTATPSSGALAAGASTTVILNTSANATNENGGQSYTETIHLHTGGIGGAIVDTLTATLVVDALYLSPSTNFISIGEPGGPFTPPSTVYVISNATPKVLGYSAFTSNSWTSLSAPSAFNITGNSITGTVAGFSAANVTLSINSSADSLGIGTYDDQLIVTNVGAGTALTTQPSIRLQIGFGIFDDFTTYAVGNVVGQNNWNGGTIPPDINPVQILTIVDGTNCVGCLGGTNEYVVPGGCANASGTSQQPYKYVAFGPVTNAFNIVGPVTNNVPTYAVTGMLVTFTNAPSSSNYMFVQGNVFLSWNDAGIIQNGSGYSWTTELDQYQTGGGPEGSAVYNFGQQYEVFFVTDFVESNAYVFVNPPGPSVDPTALALVNDSGALATNLAVSSNGEGADPCPSGDCIGNAAQGWESITLGQYSSDCTDGVQPGYFVTRVAASTNYADVWNWLNPGAVTPPTDPYTAWQDYYFGSVPGGTNCTLCGGNASYTGDGMSNTNKFLAGFNPTNSAAYLHIISVAKQSANVNITYLGASGDTNYTPGFSLRTNVLDYTTGTANGSYTTNNWVLGVQTNILGVGIGTNGGTGLGTVTNFVDVGGATSSTTRYYRVRVVLP